jgi:FtsZ-binding cell division protein ZapB
VLTARIIALLEENNRLLQELATARQERDALERALAALERHQKRERFDFTLAEPAKGGSR